MESQQNQRIVQQSIRNNMISLICLYKGHKDCQLKTCTCKCHYMAIKLPRLNWIKFLHYIECGCDTALKIREIRTILSERELKILALKWGLEDGQANTLEAVGQEFGITRERVRQIELKAIRKLRDKMD